MTQKARTANFEIEVKFAIPNKEIFDTLKKSTRLGDFVLAPVGTKITTDRYWDTPNKDVMQAGFACRIRTVNQKHVLTLKSLTPPEGAVHRRQEIETPVSSNLFQDLPEGKPKDLVLSLAGLEALEVLFTIHQTRHVFHLLSNSVPIFEVSFDEVTLGEATGTDFFELEAELLAAGDEADLTQLTAILQTQWLLQPETRSKFERAMAQISG